MNILLTNDDGIESDGLKILAERLSQDHNVYVLAPDSNRSAVSNHITLFKTNKLHKISEKKWSCGGFPADCSGIGLTSNLFDVKFDAVISGINAGANLGTDIIYSGTCAGARQAVLDSIPGIAVSVDPIKWGLPFKYDAIADFTAKNLDLLISMTNVTGPRVFVNVNGASLDSYKGVKQTSVLCIRKYTDEIVIEKNGDDYESHFKSGDEIDNYPDNSDFSIVRDGYISVSRVYAEPVCTDVVDGVTFKL